MKKKAIKIAASTAVAASAFVAAAPAQQADAATNVNQLTTNAQNAGTVLKWAISVEGSADYVTRPYDQYNAAKKAIAAAEAAAKKATASEQLSIAAKLVEPKLQVKRAAAYIDAITSSEKIKDLTSKLDAAIKTDDIEKVETAYHAATGEYRKQAALLDRVYGQSTRDGIRNAVKPAIEKLVASVKNEVTVNMLIKSADVAAKAKKYDVAAKNVSEAQSIIDANELKWEANLQKSLTDVSDDIPLSLLSVTRVNETTLVVTLNKATTGVTASEFSLDNGASVTSAVLGTDKKTVTLTTTTQAEGKTYVLSYKGTSVSFVTSPAAPGNISVNTADVHAESGQNVAIVATFKEGSTNLPSRNQVIDVTLPEGTKLVSSNGVAATGDLLAGTDGAGGTSTGKLTTDNNGQLVLIVTSYDTDAAVGGTITFVKPNGDKQETGEVNFYKLVDPSLALNNTSGVVEFVDAANDYAVVTGGQKIKFKKSGDVFQELGKVVTLDAFKAKLSEGDVLHGTYYKDTASVINLAFDKAPTKAFTLTQKALSTTKPFRSLGNSVLLSGNGEPGKVIGIYAGSNAGAAIDVASLPVAQTTVNANGTWSVSVGFDTNATAAVEYAAYQHTDNTTLPAYSAASASAKVLDVVAGDFGLTQTVTPNVANTENASLVNDQFTFAISPVAGFTDTAVVDSNATITVKDFDGTTVKFVNKDTNGTLITAGAGTLDVKFGTYNSLISNGTVAGLQGELVVTEITGVKNEYGLKINLVPNGIKTITKY